MSQTLPFQKLRIYQISRELAVLVQQARLRDLELSDQATRAAKSCFLNVAEGLPSRQAGIRRRHFAIANGSVCEVVAAIDLSLALGIVSDELAEPILSRAAEIARMLSAMSR